MKNQLFLKSLAIDTKIGIHPNEKENEQRILLDLNFTYDAKKAIKNDAITQAIDYESVASLCQNFAQKHQFELVETFNHQLAECLFSHFNIQKITIQLSKSGGMKQCESYGVISEFERGDFI